MRRWRSLRDGRDFARVLSRGRRIRCETLTGVGTPARDGLRIGFVVRRGTGGAVTRNAIKRRLRAAADLVEPRAADVVLLGDERALSGEFQKLVMDMEEVVSEVGS